MKLGVLIHWLVDLVGIGFSCWQSLGFYRQAQIVRYRRSAEPLVIPNFIWLVTAYWIGAVYALWGGLWAMLVGCAVCMATSTLLMRELHNLSDRRGEVRHWMRVCLVPAVIGPALISQKHPSMAYVCSSSITASMMAVQLLKLIASKRRGAMDVRLQLALACGAIFWGGYGLVVGNKFVAGVNVLFTILTVTTVVCWRSLPDNEGSTNTESVVVVSELVSG